MKVLPGAARKLSLPLLAVGLLGWILFVVGFGAVNNGVNYKNGLSYPPPSANCRNISYLAIPFQRASLYWFPHWVVVIAGPFFFICSLLHLIFSKWFTGIPTLFLTSLYLVCGGAVVYTWAVELFGGASDLIAVQGYCPPEGWLTDIQWGLWPLIEWVGALFSVVILTCYMMMWSCFSDGSAPVYEGGDYEGGEGYEGEEYEAEYEEEQGAGDDDEDKDEPQETTVE